MKRLNFLVIGKNQDILDTLKRVIENQEGWQAEICSDEAFCREYLNMHPVDILLLSSGLDEKFEAEMKEFAGLPGKDTRVIEHYGGGSGLLKNEVYSLFPEWSS
ncbi:MAG: hypothetical protein LRY55_11680 [Leadbetterella sp.]|nr:hypothetical protein [Leadbetterella sp.]